MEPENYYSKQKIDELNAKIEHLEKGMFSLPETANGTVNVVNEAEIKPTWFKMPERERRAIEVLDECADLMRAKGNAYNRVPQAEYYPNGLQDIWVMMHQKMTRMRSLLAEPGENDFESLEDSARDLINYAAFFIEYAEGKMDGQKKDDSD